MDASNSGLGVVLDQEKDGKEVVIAYAGRQLKDSEREYATIQKECLAILWGYQALSLLFSWPTTFYCSNGSLPFTVD